jgi:hypothetical protein
MELTSNETQPVIHFYRLRGSFIFMLAMMQYLELKRSLFDFTTVRLKTKTHPDSISRFLSNATQCSDFGPFYF